MNKIVIPVASIIGVLFGTKGVLDNNVDLIGFGIIWVLVDIAMAIRERGKG